MEPPFLTQADFHKAMLGEDELGVVIRGHLHVEAALEEVLRFLLHSHKYLQKLNLEYAERVYLAAAVGMPENLVPPLLALGSIRNGFAHNREMSLTKSRATEFYKSFSSSEKPVLHQALEATRAQLPSAIGPSLRQLEPKLQFIIYTVSLWVMVNATLLRMRALSDRADG